MRLLARLRAAAPLLLGAHLLQLVLLGAGRLCPADGDIGSRAVRRVVEATHDATAHASHHAVHGDVAAPAAHHPAPGSAPSHQHGSHGSPDATCTMLMACTTSAVAASAPSFTTQVTIVSNGPSGQVASLPAFITHAPDTPPPRA
jgi:hypothetical protein